MPGQADQLGNVPLAVRAQVMARLPNDLTGVRPWSAVGRGII
ncbi:hypothetical protein [Geodermatophilus sp. DSM 45219]|nr:hypothetical protein [Geodermatophilus sp. DSM 45219]